MDATVLKQLLEDSGIINEDTSQKIQDAFATAINEAKQEATEAVTAELTEQYIEDRKVLIAAIDEQIQEALNESIAELKDDINDFRDLEIEYSQKLVEQEKQLAIKAQKDLNELVEALDAYIGIQLGAEVDLLREDLDIAIKQQRGMRIFEAFVDEFKEFYVDADSAVGRAAMLEAEVQELLNALAESEEANDELVRNMEMQRLLSTLSGDSREVMESLLRNVDTENLQESFDRYIDRVLSPNSANQSTPLNENSQSQQSVKFKTGDTIANMLNEGNYTEPKTSTVNESADDVSWLKRLAGNDEGSW